MKLIESPTFSTKFRFPMASPTIISRSLSLSISYRVGCALNPKSNVLLKISFIGELPIERLIILGFDEMFSK